MAWQKPFSEQEDEFIRMNWPAKTPTELAKLLGRSRPGVSARITKLGLRGGASAMRARVVDAPVRQKDSVSAMASAASSGGEIEVLEALRSALIESFGEAAVKDRQAIAKRIMEASERISEISGEKGAARKDKAGAEVTPFEVIARKRAARRQAAQG